MTRIWKKFIDLSLKEFNRIYDYLNVHFESYRGESAYSKDMKNIIKLLDEKGITQVSEGAKVIDLENEGKVVLIDYSSPNIAKQFHIGHLKTTVIGGMFAKLFRALRI